MREGERKRKDQVKRRWAARCERERRRGGGKGRWCFFFCCCFLLWCVAFRLQRAKQRLLGPQDLHHRRGEDVEDVEMG